MPTEVQLAQAVQDSYLLAPTWERGGFRARFSLVDNHPVIAFPGTRLDDPHDILTDIEAVPTHDRDLGWCHSGFLAGARALYPLLGLPHMVQPIFVGHSMGAAIALLVAARARLDWHEPREVVTFGAPRTGGLTLSATLRGLPIRMYRNGNDPVPSVPWHFLGLYCHPRALIQVGTAKRDPIMCHLLSSYQQVLQSYLEDFRWVR